MKEKRIHASPWEPGPALSSRRSYAASAELRGRIYVAGGMVGETGRHLATVQRLDPSRGSWETLAPLPEAVRAGEGAALGGQFYVVGGTTPQGGGREVFAYEPRRNEWRRAAPLPVRRFNHAVVALAGRLWVLGGYAGGRERADVFVYDPAQDAWSRGPSLPRPIHAFAAVAFRGEIWVIGGRRGERTMREVRILDADTGAWRHGPPLPQPMELLGADVAGDEIHAVRERTYQIWDAREWRWRVGPAPTVPRHALAVFHVDGVLFAVGGCTAALRDSAVVETRQL